MAGFTHKALSDRALERRVQKAREVLGFGLGAMPTREAVKQRYLTMVKENHPDHPSAIKLRGYQMDYIVKAKNFLLKHLENEDG